MQNQQQILQLLQQNQKQQQQVLQLLLQNQKQQQQPPPQQQQQQQFHPLSVLNDFANKQTDLSSSLKPSSIYTALAANQQNSTTPTTTVNIEPAPQTTGSIFSVKNIALASIIAALGFVIAAFFRDAILGTVRAVVPNSKHKWYTKYLIAMVVTIILVLIIFIIIEIFSYDNKKQFEKLGTKGSASAFDGGGDV